MNEGTAAIMVLNDDENEKPVKQRKWPDWGLSPGPSRHIPNALTTELSGLYQYLLIMPLPSE